MYGIIMGNFLLYSSNYLLFSKVSTRNKNYNKKTLRNKRKRKINESTFWHLTHPGASSSYVLKFETT